MTKEPTGESFPFDSISYMSATVWEYTLIQNPTLKEKRHLWECPIKVTVVN